MSEAGTPCSARTRLEFDHIEEVARGGEPSVSGIRLSCRPHNELMAERAFGAEFIRHKRLAAAERRAAGRSTGHTADAGTPALPVVAGSLAGG